MPNLIGGIVLGYIWLLIINGVLYRFQVDITFSAKYGFWGLVIVTNWQMVGYMMVIYIAAIQAIPTELVEAAQIDGANDFKIFRRIILPLTYPALASFAIFQFLWVWNDYLVALVFIGDKNRVITSALAALVGEKGQDWHLLTSGAFISMLLPLAVFFALQRYFVRGLLAGSVKG